MEASKMKNIVVLKNLPSNIIDEAIVVLKSSKKIKKLQKIEQNKNIISNEKVKKDKDYIVKEAEMIITNYISKIEKKDEKNIFNKNIKTKYEKMRKYAIITTIMCIIQTLLIIF